MTPRHHRKGIGLWLAAGLLFLMQAGVHGEANRRVAGPSQGALPVWEGETVLAAANGPSGARGFAPESGTGGTAQDGGSRPAPVGDRHAPIDSMAASPAPAGGGGGGGNAKRSAVVPVLRGNPDGVDAVPTAPSPSATNAGGGGGPATENGPFIRVLPGGDAADWTRSPSPGAR